MGWGLVLLAFSGIVGSTGARASSSAETMARINHTVEQLTTADTYTAFTGLQGINLTVTLPDWHEPFPIQVRMGAANPRKLDMAGLSHVCKAWYINGQVADQWTISTLCGAIQVPAGTRIETEELPEKWEANSKEASKGEKEWFAYSNDFPDFYKAL